MIASDPPDIETEQLRLAWLDEAALAAVAEGDPEPAERRIRATISAAWIAEARHLCALRAEQMRRSPDDAPWLMRAVVLQTAGEAIGQVGFHGGPGINGLQADDAVELGYSILPAFRGRGFATEAARGLMEWAIGERGVQRFLASVSPTNPASIRVAQKLGFDEVSRVWDEVDGEEIVYQRLIRA